MFLLIVNLILGYIVGMMLAAAIWGLFMPQGTLSKKITILVVTIGIETGLYFWGDTLGYESYIWFFSAIIIWNIIAQRLHIQKRRKQQVMQNIYGDFRE